MEHVLRILASWDDEANVWVVESTDVPGLVAEAETIPQLLSKLKILIPEMLAENDHLRRNESEIPFEVVASVRSFASIPA